VGFEQILVNVAADAVGQVAFVSLQRRRRVSVVRASAWLACLAALLALSAFCGFRELPRVAHVVLWLSGAVAIAAGALLGLGACTPAPPLRSAR
jgi:hypothetical protein